MTVKPTSMQAARAAIPKTKSRRERALSWLQCTGRKGATREEIATHLDVPIQSVCSIVLDAIKDGLMVETDQRRVTRHGALAGVVVHIEHAEQFNSADEIRAHIIDRFRQSGRPMNTSAAIVIAGVTYRALVRHGLASEATQSEIDAAEKLDVYDRHKRSSRKSSGSE